MSWTDERIEKLKTLWAEGMSASQIARALGDGTTRNSVLSKIHRMGMAERSTGWAPKKTASRSLSSDELAAKNAERARFRTGQAARAKAAEEVALPPAFLSDGSPITIATVKFLGQCKWIYAADDLSNAPMCGNKAKPGDVWCPYHKAKMTVRNSGNYLQGRHERREQSYEAERGTGIVRAFGGGR